MTRLAASHGTRWRARIAIVAILAAGVVPHAAGAQERPLSGFSRQNLQFGALFPGVPAAVARTDALRAGQFELRGERLTEVRVDLALPAALVGAGGQTLPLRFASGDAGHALTADIAAAAGFDPRAPLVARLSNNGRLYIFLGGTAVPSATQQSGTYTAQVTATVAYLGN